MRKYDHLFFDLDNTLWDFATNSELAMKQTLEEFNLLTQLPSFNLFFEVYEQINHSLWNDYHIKKISKQNLIIERFSRSLQNFNIADLNWEELNRKYLENMALQTGLFAGTVETLTTLKEKGYNMHIITNGFKEVQHKKLNNCGLSGFFSNVFISEEIQTTKPHRQIFEHSLKSVNASKKKSVMIGDSWETDIEGALSFGIDQVMFTNNGIYFIPEPVKKELLEQNPALSKLNHHTKTWFINEIPDLLTFL
jgi:putative hydrolase of the HAD superfamily